MLGVIFFWRFKKHSYSLQKLVMNKTLQLMLLFGINL